MTGDRNNLLSGIQAAGGIKALKKVDRTKVRDRSTPMVPGAEDSGPAGSGMPPAANAGGGGGMQDALAAALAKRKKKIVDSGELFGKVMSGRMFANLEQMMRRIRMTTIGRCVYMSEGMRCS